MLSPTPIFDAMSSLEPKCIYYGNSNGLSQFWDLADHGAGHGVPGCFICFRPIDGRITNDQHFFHV
jgi:hypothetical protein